MRALTVENPSVTLQSEGGPLKVAPRSVPDEFALESSYPNPVSGQATIEYAVPEQSEVTVEVYDVLGRRVATLVDGEKKAGGYSVQIDANDLSSGTYFYRMRAADFTETRRLVVV
jgi:flagellar hook assembly protein FlgD